MGSNKHSATSSARQRGLRRALALFGLAALFGAPAVAQVAQVSAARAALDARVAQVRDALHQAQGVTTAPMPDSQPDAQTPATPKWANWPNWGNWNNWPNWGNWFNHR